LSGAADRNGAEGHPDGVESFFVWNERDAVIVAIARRNYVAGSDPRHTEVDGLAGSVSAFHLIRIGVIGGHVYPELEAAGQERRIVEKP